MLEFKNKGARVELWVLNDALFISISQLKSAEYSPKMCSTQEAPGWCHVGNRSNVEVDARIREDVMRSRVTFCTFISHPSSSGKSPILFLRPRGFPWLLLSSWDCPLSQRDDRSHVAKTVHLLCNLLCPSEQASVVLTSLLWMHTVQGPLNTC